LPHCLLHALQSAFGLNFDHLPNHYWSDSSLNWLWRSSPAAALLLVAAKKANDCPTKTSAYHQQQQHEKNPTVTTIAALSNLRSWSTGAAEHSPTTVF